MNRKRLGKILTVAAVVLFALFVTWFFLGPIIQLLGWSVGWWAGPMGLFAGGMVLCIGISIIIDGID